MIIKFLGTGSKGNAIVIQSNGVTVMVDCGIPKTKIEKALIENGIRPDSIDAIFLTHGHKDHVQGLPMAAKYNIPVYASAGTWKTIGEYDGERFVLPPKRSVRLDGFGVGSFRTHHDDYDSFGYCILDESTAKIASVCLDTGHVDAEMLDAMRGSDVYIIEANYADAMLETSKYHDSLKRRIRGDNGHLSNEQVAEALSKLVTGRGEKIYLCHMSSHTNLPALAMVTVQRALMKKGLKKDKHYFLEVF